MQKTVLILTGVFFLLEFYFYQAIKIFLVNPAAKWAYIYFTVLSYAFFLYSFLTVDSADHHYGKLQVAFSVFLILFLPKLFTSLFLLIDDVFRVIQYGVGRFGNAEMHYPERRKFIAFAGLGLTALFSGLFLDGIIFGKYRHTVRRVKIKIKNLPQSFRGYRIVQISDVHSGSFQHPEKLRHAIDLINKQNADLVLFTGDMVNNYADEFKTFVNLFAEIKAKDGKFSVLGNHDYGDYGKWNSAAEHAQNIPNLINLQKKAGFTMLRNEHFALEKNGEKLYVIGVDNWGEKPFPQFGDLDKATAGIPQDAAKILMSHDPTHFDRIVKFHPSDISLTMSGHTHGMQFGLDLKNVKWSPVQFRYKKWADLYESEGKYLYVNRGFGVLAYPGRVGVNPEITVFELS